MAKDIQAEIDTFEQAREGRKILEQVAEEEGVENLSENDLKKLGGIVYSGEGIILREDMHNLVLQEKACLIPYAGKPDAFRLISHTTYREGRDGWYPLPHKFFGH